MAFQKYVNGWWVTSKSAIDKRIILSKTEMLSVTPNAKKTQAVGTFDDDRSRFAIDCPYFAICKDDSGMYIFDWNSIQDPETGYYHRIGQGVSAGTEGQVLIYKNNDWVPSTLTDGGTLMYVKDKGIQLMGFSSATEGQMLVKQGEGVAWVAPASLDALEAAVAQARGYATQAGNAAAQALITKANCDAVYQRICDKIWYGTMEEYNALTEVFNDTVYIILDGALTPT